MSSSNCCFLTCIQISQEARCQNDHPSPELRHLRSLFLQAGSRGSFPGGWEGLGLSISPLLAGALRPSSSPGRMVSFHPALLPVDGASSALSLPVSFPARPHHPPSPPSFQAPSGSQASSRGEAKDSALLSSGNADLLEPTEWPQGSPASSSVWREDPGFLSRPCRKRRPSSSVLAREGAGCGSALSPSWHVLVPGDPLRVNTSLSAGFLSATCSHVGYIVSHTEVSA